MEVVKGVWESKSINAECILSSGGVKISVLCRERCTTMPAKKKSNQSLNRSDIHGAI